MLFNSLEFLIFFPVVVIIHFVLPYRYRWVFLLGASYYFYMCWRIEYIFLIITSTLVDYYAAIKIANSSTNSKQKKFLALSLLINFGILFTFKYFNFFNDSFGAFFKYFNIDYSIPGINVILPVGISFYTFQTLSYTLEVYQGKAKPEKHPGKFALYVAFFPQLVAGPIERPNRLLPQFYQKHQFDYQRVTDGLKLITWGFFKKLVIADNVAFYVNMVYNDPSNYQGIPIIIATYLFAFQIYCDFSGYSDIAIGSAQVMGYNLMENFKRPYLARSIPEFWKRWHISLSTWFRDYLYFPLGGNRVVKWRWYFNVLIVFVVSGLWHGANWTFIVWGGLNGVYYIISGALKSKKEKLYKILYIDRFHRIHKIVEIFITFHLICFSWIIFRANSLSDAWLLIKNMFLIHSSKFSIDRIYVKFGIFQVPIAIFVSIIFLVCIDGLQERVSIRQFLSKQPFWLRWAAYYAILMVITIFGAFSLQQEFIYFQF